MSPHGMLAGRTALVTGGASGIGEAAVRKFLAEGARVVFTDLQQARGEALAAELSAAHGDACAFLPGDHTRESDNAAAVALAAHRFGGLDILYNNAGMVLQGGIGETKGPQAVAGTGGRLGKPVEDVGEMIELGTVAVGIAFRERIGERLAARSIRAQ